MQSAIAADRIREILNRILGTDPPPGTDVIESGLLDSLSLVELIFALEQEFNVSLELDSLELDDFRTVENMTAFVESQRADAA